MPNNFLEELVAEWYEFQGYFIRRNIPVGKRPKGGYQSELDIVCFHLDKKELPDKKELVPECVKDIETTPFRNK